MSLQYALRKLFRTTAAAITRRRHHHLLLMMIILLLLPPQRIICVVVVVVDGVIVSIDIIDSEPEPRYSATGTKLGEQFSVTQN